MERLYTTDELAEYLRVDVVTIRRLVSRGELPAYRIGSEYRFAPADLEEYLQHQRVTIGSVEASDPVSGVPKEWPPKMQAGRDRFDRFNDEARQALNFAQEEAQHLMHNYIGTEHLLLALLRAEDGCAVRILRNLSVELNKVRKQVETIISRGDRIVSGEIGLTPRAKKAIELAVDEARRFDHHYIGTEHLLLGLIREGQGIAAGVLESVGVNLEKARGAMIRVLAPEQESTTETVPPPPPEAVGLVAAEDAEIVCNRCGAHNFDYFRYCFNCGQQLHA